MNIGLHFGSTYTTVALLDKKGNLKCVDLDAPPPGDKELHHLACHVPTAIAYGRGSSLKIGSDALETMLNKTGGFEHSDQFRRQLYLNGESNQWPHSRSPQDMSVDFLKALFDRLGKETKDLGEIVCGVPDHLVQSPDSSNALLLQPLRNVLSIRMGARVKKFCSESVCILANYRAKHPEVDGRTILVIDIGGHTFNAALCKVDGPRIEILDSTQSEFGSKDFDRELISRIVDPSKPEFEEILYDFQIEKRKKVKNSELLTAARAVDYDRFEDFPSLKASAIDLEGVEDIKYISLIEVAIDYRSRIKDALSPILNGRRKKFDHVLLAGGFACFPFLEKAIYDAIGDSNIPFTTTSEETKLRAVAYGAALVANDKISVDPPPPFTMGVVASQRKDGKFKELRIPVLLANTYQAGGGVIWAKNAETNKHLVIEVAPESTTLKIPLYVLHDTQKSQEIDVYVEATLQPGIYHVGLFLEYGEYLYFVFKNAEAGQENKVTYVPYNANSILSTR